MNFKTLVATAALTALPVVASAAVIPIADGGTTLITGSNDNLYTFTVPVTGTGPGGFSHTFTLSEIGGGIVKTSLVAELADMFTGLVAEWLNADDMSVLATGTADADGDIELSTTFTADPDTLSQIMSISWTGVDKGVPSFDGVVKVSTVPVPAALLLMGTALAGLGLTRRKA